MTDPELPETYRVGRMTVVGLLTVGLVLTVVGLVVAYVTTGEVSALLDRYVEWSDETLGQIGQALRFPWQ